MATKRATNISLLGRELGQFLLISALAFGLMRLTQNFWDDALTMLAGSSAIMAGMILVKRDLAVTITGLMIGVLGPLFEMGGVSAGAWSFANPHIEGVPAWLFLVWGAGGIFIASLYEFLRILINHTQAATASADETS